MPSRRGKKTEDLHENDGERLCGGYCGCWCEVKRCNPPKVSIGAPSSCVPVGHERGHSARTTPAVGAVERVHRWTECPSRPPYEPRGWPWRRPKDRASDDEPTPVGDGKFSCRFSSVDRPNGTGGWCERGTRRTVGDEDCLLVCCRLSTSSLFLGLTFGTTKALNRGSQPSPPFCLPREQGPRNVDTGSTAHFETPRALDHGVTWSRRLLSHLCGTAKGAVLLLPRAPAPPGTPTHPSPHPYSLSERIFFPRAIRHQPSGPQSVRSHSALARSAGRFPRQPERLSTRRRTLVRSEVVE